MSEAALASRDAYAFWATDTIRYSDLDPNGHVNNGAMNSYLEDGRVRFRNERLTASESDVLRGFVLVKFSVEYRAQLHFPGDVDIGTATIRIGNSSYSLGQGLFRDMQCIAVAEVVTVRVDPESGRPTPLGDGLRAVLAENAAQGFVL